MTISNFHPLDSDLLGQALNRTGAFSGQNDGERRTAAIKTASLRGLNTNVSNSAEADRVARLVVALAPEHRVKAPTYTPAERLSIHEELSRVNRDAALDFEKEDPNAIKLARAAREQGRRAIENRRRDLNGEAWRLEQRLGDARAQTGLRGALQAAETRLWELRQQPPHLPGVADKVAAEAIRVEQLKAEAATLEQQANEARTAAANLQEV